MTYESATPLHQTPFGVIYFGGNKELAFLQSPKFGKSARKRCRTRTSDAYEERRRAFARRRLCLTHDGFIL